MDLFRRNQKIIFWIVTIIIVPSFVLVWGVGGLFNPRNRGGDGSDSYNAGKVNGKDLSYHSFDAFRKRIQAAVGGLPLQVSGAPGAGTTADQLWKFIFANSIWQDAEAAGTIASDLQIGTYLEHNHPYTSQVYNKADPKSMEKAVDQFCRQMQMTRGEFLKGVREWQTMGNYITCDANLTAVNDDTVFVYYALNNSEVVVKRVRVAPNEALTAQAKQEVMAAGQEELEKAVAAHVADRVDDRRFRTPAAWRFAYILTPFVAEANTRPPTDQEVEAYYQTNRTGRYNNQPFENVKDSVKTDLMKQEAERQTMRNLTIDVDPQLRSHPDMPLDELTRLTQLAKYGVKAGDTGSEPLAAADVPGKLPAGAGRELALLLDVIDSAKGQERDKFIADWKSGFIPVADMQPVRVADGLLRLKLLEYVPSVPAELRGADGKMNEKVYEAAVSDMVAAKVDELVRDKALATEKDLRALLDARKAGTAAPKPEMAAEFDGLTEEVIPYLQITDANYALGRLVVGEMVGPLPFTDSKTGASGQELVVMVDRRVPARSAFDGEADAIKLRYRMMSRANYQGNFGFTYTASGPAAIVQPSPAIMGELADRFNRGELAINQDLVRTAPRSDHPLPSAADMAGF